jgi:hypothetical protein
VAALLSRKQKKSPNLTSVRDKFNQSSIGVCQLQSIIYLHAPNSINHPSAHAKSNQLSIGALQIQLVMQHA